MATVALQFPGGMRYGALQVHCEEVIAAFNIWIKRRLFTRETKCTLLTKNICQNISRRKSISLLKFYQIGSTRATGEMMARG